ncbi:M17 family peptidase N-terminal domain-containing protein [Anaerocolumna sp. AGMB13025]|uniref:leucyl aminopeptidase family protein n=1 Tax=Anaerocolumna sp. AGMB13025 TaxID=3039116 RepID=UPI00241E7F37|nr:M17 family peptidase N-terminal domain-containing protein [Anaerocolumna sp. AGMB13025]WFR55996.1 M17 family peptidase N-terminal domain-containing protein [Anaerocolumna sp. AGMB13025]
MIRIDNDNSYEYSAEFFFEKDADRQELPDTVQKIFDGGFLKTQFLYLGKEGSQSSILLVGLGKDITDKIEIKEAAAKVSSVMKSYKIKQFGVNISKLYHSIGLECVRDITEGLMLGLYEERKFPETERDEYDMILTGIPEGKRKEAKLLVQETVPVIEGVIFARDMVNLPGNKLRPEDFAGEIIKFLRNTKVMVETLDFGQLKEMGMGGLVSVGESSEFPPVFVILRYINNPDCKDITALVGKGVTCDTGGYCLKPAGSMLGIKGDMAGGAAVAGAIYALAQNQVKTNVIGFIPVCENRISPGSLLPGDVITSYSGKTIEVLNTDAEGRLILADTIAYAAAKEHVTKVLDIATLTGAVVNMLGFSVAGVVTDSQEFFDEFRAAYHISGERYWRLPVYPEHEKMIQSKIADIKNMGEKYCGTITAGLFIKAFAEGLPWLHIDIAGTAWVDSPIFAYQSKGATGAGVTSIYHLCSREGGEY